MPVVNVEASIEINASSEKMYQVLVDFTTWPTWSPWLYIELEASVSYIRTAGQLRHSCEWRGGKTGAVAMTL